MRGVFNPWFRVGETIAALGGAAWLSVWVYNIGSRDPSASWAKSDAFLAPFLCLLGLLAGHLLGRRRLAFLRRVWPELEGRFFATEAAALDQYGDASNFVQLQLSVYAWTIVATLGVATYSAGKVVPLSSACAFVAGLLLTSKTVPLVRLWAERRRGALASPLARVKEQGAGQLTEEAALRRLAADVLVRLMFGMLIASIAFVVAKHTLLMTGAVRPRLGIDLRLAAVGLLAGAFVGHLIGVRRLRVLRQCWPQIPRFMFLADRRLLARWPEGESVVRLEKAVFAGALAIWVILLFATRLGVVLDVIFAWYFFAWYVADLTLPSVRLWLEVRQRRSRASPPA
jgi:hypothetical protein